MGASAAGLATAACLQRMREPAVVLEQADRVGAAWRGHYDRLQLHTDRARSGLPHRPMPGSYPRYPSRDQVVAYLEDYAAHFGIEPRFGERVTSIRRVAGSWRVTTTGSRYLAESVVVATGYTRVPNVATFPGRDEFAGEVLHSSEYSSGARFRGRRVLVVGFGNSGGEIAIELHEHGAVPTLAVRGPVNVIPREILGVPILALGIAMRRLPAAVADALARSLLQVTVGNLEKLGLRRLPYGPNRQIRENGRIPLIDVGTLALIRQGAIAVRPGVERFTETGVAFSGGADEPFDAVVLATGYRPGLADFLEPASEVTGATGAPIASGRETLPGLYFCGFYVSPTGMLREIAIEARRIARSIAATDRKT